MMSARRLAREMWSELEHRLGAADKRLLGRLPAPATPTALDHYERLLGASLPPLVRELYSVHDGLGMPAYVPVGGYMYGASSFFLCLNDSVDAWTLMTNALRDGSFADWSVESTRGGVRAHWWNALWIPVASDGRLH